MSATPNRRQLLRRDFLIGTAAGVAVGVGGFEAVASASSPEWATRLSAEGKVSHAQHGEDLVVRSLLTQKGIEAPTYLDIGAFDPIYCNNTYYFYRQGGRGVLVEPNPDMTTKLRRVRPKDTVLNIGIGLDADPAADFYVMADPQLHTFDKEQAERLQKDWGVAIKQVIKMPLVNINTVIAEHLGNKAPDLLSIDVEGLEFPILKTLDLSKYRPKVICVDALITGTLTQRTDSTEYLAERGYLLRGMTYPNTIYVDKAFFTM
jgi:FkbM family methyltransferase